jgi:methyl-accepting chemotaxis protein
VVGVFEQQPPGMGAVIALSVGTFEEQDDTFEEQGDTFEEQEDSFEEQGDAFEEQEDSFEEQGDAFEEQGDAFEEQGDTFEEQVEAASRVAQTPWLAQQSVVAAALAGESPSQQAVAAGAAIVSWPFWRSQ